jgi:hypothetical protein
MTYNVVPELVILVNFYYPNEKCNLFLIAFQAFFKY